MSSELEPKIQELMDLFCSSGAPLIVIYSDPTTDNVRMMNNVGEENLKAILAKILFNLDLSTKREGGTA